MKIKILKTHDTAIDCRTIRSFVKDEIVDDLSIEICHDLIKNNFATEYLEEKMLNQVIENKAILTISENKKIEEVVNNSETIIEEVSEDKETKLINKKRGKK
jgi:hypothetical protein